MKIEVGATNLETDAGCEARILMVEEGRAYGVWRGSQEEHWIPHAWDSETGESVYSNMSCNLREKAPEWYENIPPEGVLCWVWDIAECRINAATDLIKDYMPTFSCPFVGVRVWRYATPIKPSECWGYKGEGK
ncbi:hypothetical protein [Porticoccus sp.]